MSMNYETVWTKLKVQGVTYSHLFTDLTYSQNFLISMSTTQKMFLSNEWGGLILRETFCLTILFMTWRQKVQFFFHSYFHFQNVDIYFCSVIRYYLEESKIFLIYSVSSVITSFSSLALKLLAILRLTVFFFP